MSASISAEVFVLPVEGVLADGAGAAGVLAGVLAGAVAGAVGADCVAAGGLTGEARGVLATGLSTEGFS